MSRPYRIPFSTHRKDRLSGGLFQYQSNISSIADHQDPLGLKIYTGSRRSHPGRQDLIDGFLRNRTVFVFQNREELGRKLRKLYGETSKVKTAIMIAWPCKIVEKHGRSAPTQQKQQRTLTPTVALCYHTRNRSLQFPTQQNFNFVALGRCVKQSGPATGSKGASESGGLPYAKICRLPRGGAGIFELS